MTTALHGQMLWEDSKIIDRELVSYAERMPTREPLRAGWSPYTSFQWVGARNYLDSISVQKSRFYAGGEGSAAHQLRRPLVAPLR